MIHQTESFIEILMVRKAVKGNQFW